MDTMKIKALIRAVQCKSLSKAAEEFSYTPSALSHSVDSLEEQLGVRLLKRSFQGVELTEDGMLLWEKLTALLQAEAELLHSASAIADRRRHHLRIGTYSSISSNLLPEILPGFKERYPEITISITVGNLIGDWLDDGKADLLLGVENHGNEWFPFAEDPYVAVVPNGFFPGKTSLRWEELISFPFIITENSTVRRHVDLDAFRETIHLTSEDDGSAISMVREGLGVTILSKLAMKNHREGIRILPLEPGFSRTLGFSYKKGSPENSAAMKFLRYMKGR